MSLTSAQAAALKVDYLADAALQTIFANSPNGAQAVADEYNKLATPDFYVWKSAVPTQDIFDAVQWDRYTPTDAPDSTAVWLARAVAIRIKQENLQTFMFRDAIDASKSGIRSGLRDAVIAVPSGASGANVSPGGASGATVLEVCRRLASRVEKLLTTGASQTGNTAADVMGFEGPLTAADFELAMR